MALPYFPYYVDDYEADTAHLTIAEDGAYIRLLRQMTDSEKQPFISDFIHFTLIARGFTKNQYDVSGAFIPELNGRFGLTLLAAIEAGGLAHNIEQGGNHVFRN